MAIITAKEIQAVIKIDARKRYKYLLNKISDQSCLYILDNDGWCMLADNNGCEYLPIWPAEQYAVLYATEEYSDYKALKIDVEEFIEDIADDLISSSVDICPFPVTGMPAITLSARDFVANIQHELEKYNY